MKIGIIGAGNVGTGIGRRLAAMGHDIVVSFARSPDKVAAAAAAIGAGARAGSPEEAAQHGDVVILATPWSVTPDAVRSVAAALSGRILWDTTNPLLPDMQGLEIGTDTSAGEQIAAAAPGARVVKAIPPFAELLHGDSTVIAGHRPSTFVAGDDADARRTILALVDQIGADGVDAGPLSMARSIEPLGLLLVRLAYMQGFGPRIGSFLLRENGG